MLLALEGTDFMTAVTSAISQVLAWIGTFISSLLGTETGTGAINALNPLLPLFAIGVAISAILLGVKMVKSIIWGA